MGRRLGPDHVNEYSEIRERAFASRKGGMGHWQPVKRKAFTFVLRGNSPGKNAQKKFQAPSYFSSDYEFEVLIERGMQASLPCPWRIHNYAAVGV